MMAVIATLEGFPAALNFLVHAFRIQIKAHGKPFSDARAQDQTFTGTKG